MGIKTIIRRIFGGRGSNLDAKTREESNKVKVLNNEVKTLTNIIDMKNEMIVDYEKRMKSHSKEEFNQQLLGIAAKLFTGEKVTSSDIAKPATTAIQKTLKTPEKMTGTKEVKEVKEPLTDEEIKAKISSFSEGQIKQIQGLPEAMVKNYAIDKLGLSSEEADRGYVMLKAM